MAPESQRGPADHIHDAEHGQVSVHFVPLSFPSAPSGKVKKQKADTRRERRHKEGKHRTSKEFKYLEAWERGITQKILFSDECHLLREKEKKNSK